MLREKNRGGQIFFVHNRINDLQERAVMLKRLFPKLNIAMAHSRTTESALEKTMSEFSAGRIDILSVRRSLRADWTSPRPIR